MFHNSLRELKCYNNKKTCPCNMPGQDDPAVPPGLAHSAHSRVLHTLTSFTSGQSVSHTLSVSPSGCSTLCPNAFLPFLFALRSPFGLIFSVAIPPSAALCVTRCKAYSLFVIGLCAYCNRFNIICQGVLKKIFFCATTLNGESG